MVKRAIVDSFHQLPEISAEVEHPRYVGESLSDFASLLTEHGVTRTVLVQPEPSPAKSKTALDLASTTQWIAAAVVWVDLKSAKVEETLDYYATNAKFRGVCHPVDREVENQWLLREDVLRGLRAVSARDLSLDLLVEPRHLPSVAELAKGLPDLRMVLDHLGSPLVAKGIREPWGVYMLNIAPYRNVWGKVSGLITRDAQPNWHVSHIKGFVEAAVRLFGYERIMFGSDWPEQASVASYQQVIETALEAAGPFTPDQEERFLSGSASEFYRLD